MFTHIFKREKITLKIVKVYKQNLNFLNMPKVSAEDLAKNQREISISEFFVKNKHLLGFDNPRKALLTTIKEAVDNSLDACEESEILPDIKIEVNQISDDRFQVIIEDNGPGIVKEQIPKIFGKLLYGSKFHRLRVSRGQQGIGISASAMYGQLTTGKPIKITSKLPNKKQAHYYELHLDTKTNEPVIAKELDLDWGNSRGTKIEIELEAKYQKGKQSIDEYLEETAIVNPHLYLIYKNPEKEVKEFPRGTNKLPPEPKEIKPHPHGIELGILIKMLHDTQAATLQLFLQKEFCRVSAKVAKGICEKAGLYEKSRPSRIARQEADSLYTSINSTKIMAPPTDAVKPMGEDLILKGLKKEIDAEFYTAVTRPPSVYRGNPFIIEVGLAYGGNIPSDGLIKVLRFANRVPLLYQQSACATSNSVMKTKWNNYGLSQSRGALPIGPVVILIEVTSVWVPFTSESKEAIAHYPEIIKEIKLGLQEAGRKLGTFIRKRKRAEHEAKKKSYIEKYLKHIGIGLKDLLELNESQEKKLTETLKDTLERSRE